MAYDKEFQITWFELAPSLQTIFLTLQNEMNVLQRNYTVMVNTLDTMQIQLDENTRDIGINRNEIAIIKQSLGNMEANIDELNNLLAGIDTDKIGDLSQLQRDIDQCILDITALYKRMRAVEDKCEENYNDIADLRIDVDNNTEWIDWLASLVEDIPDIRTDLDNNTEWLDWVASLAEEVPDLRIDIDHNTEWLSGLSKEVEELEDVYLELQIDMSHNVEWMQSISDRMETFIDEVVNLRIDMDLVTEWYQQMVDTIDRMGLLDPDFVESIWFDTIDLRMDVDLNSELIHKALVSIEDIATAVASLDELIDNIMQIRVDVDNNTEWLSHLDKLKDDAVDLRNDTDLNTELIQENRNEIENNLNEIIQNREDIDLNTELINNSFNRINALPKEIMAEVEAYINKARFINLAPKINFLQEDTVEVYPYYKMNNMSKAIVTSDQDSSEVVYLVANDGVSTTNHDLYCGYRNNDTQNFYFSNIAVNPRCFRDTSGNKNSYIDDIMCGDNNYIVVHKQTDSTVTSTDTSGWYLIETKNSRDYSTWTEAHSLSSIWNNNIVSVVWLEENDLLIIFQRADGWNDPKNAKLATMRTYKLSTMTFIKGYDIQSPYRLLSCNTATTTFSLNSVEENFFNGTCGDVGIKIDTNTNFKLIFTLNELEELLTVTMYNAAILHLPLSEMPASAPQIAYCCIRMTYDCPSDILTGGTSAGLTCYQNYGDIVFDCLDKQSSFYKDNINALYMTTSYANVKEQNYITYHDADTYNSYFIRYNNEGQTDDVVAHEDTTKYGTLNPFIPNDPLNTPDACPWGKWMYKYIMVWDKFFANCASMQYGKCVLQIDKWQKDPNDATALIPAPGEYHTVTPITMFNNYGVSSCRMSDNSARYFRTEYTGIEIVVYEYSYTDTGTDFVISENIIKTVNVSQNAWRTSVGSAVANPSFDPNTTSIFYNANSDDFVMIFIDTTGNKSSFAYSDYGFLATLGSNGNMIKCFGATNIGNYSSNWKYINDYVQSSKGTTNAIPRIRNMTFLSNVLACCCYFYNSTQFDNEEFKNVYFNFNTAKNTLTMSNGFNYEEKSVYVDKLDRGIGLIYSGPTYGLTFQGEKLDYSYNVYFCQNPIAGTWGGRKTDQVFLSTGPANNRYKFQLKSSTGLIAYVPNIAIFLGGYFTQLENPLTVVLLPNTNNYIYLERDGATLEIKAYTSKKHYIAEGARTFNKICIAKITTNGDDVTDIEYYRINNGYNDYDFHS